ncbi:MAG: NAD(P)/FAD-dependent oxidoreductase [Candidatus Eremiobacteraeota bacterium]|nr:NAD(P)/FAD-dependent oxidoreductase [Candidatus Eremiobacteraeota bacterium]MBC5802853.1 NAD(P)/FAD-dependent oxidoreductase [Candidatus Eremiobacteraeota bacterium]MBC5821470.1 NAD(P)/FAD-dependent oxidoreductase [Candidatus Eremiobacteraeota bacterium]
MQVVSRALGGFAGSTAIVGGGVLGLTLALRLAQRGERVTVFERAPNFGGLASAWTLGGVTWDRHYHVTLFSDAHTRALLRDLGLEDDLRWTTVGTGFYTDGRFYPMNNALDFLRFPPLGLLDKMRLGYTIAAGSRIQDGTPLEDIPVEDWLVRRCGRKTFEKIWRPLLLAKLGERYRDASAAFIWAIIVRLYAARRSGLGAERFGYVPGGYARILTTLEARLRQHGVELVAGAEVTSVRGQPGGDGIAITLAAGPPRTFERAVLTTPAPVAASLAPDLSVDERTRLTSKIYGGIICASLLLDHPLGPYYVTNLTDEWVPFSAVIDMSNVVDRTQWNGGALVYLPKYVRPDDPLFEEDDAAVEARFLSALERMYPNFSRERVQAFRISRVRHVFPIATLRYSQQLPPIATSVPGLLLLDSAHIINGTLNVNETLALVERGLAALDALPRFVASQLGEA